MILKNHTLAHAPPVGYHSLATDPSGHSGPAIEEAAMP